MPGGVAGTRADAHQVPSVREVGWWTRCPLRCSSQPGSHEGSAKGIFNPEENGCHSGLVQKLAKSALSETKKQAKKQTGVFLRSCTADLG